MTKAAKTAFEGGRRSALGALRASHRFRIGRAGLAALAGVLLLTAPAHADPRRLAFDMPAQNAAGALQAFAQRLNKQLLFPYDVAARRQAPAIRGQFTDTEVLERLSAAAGLAVVSNDGRTITLTAAVSAPVLLQERAVEAPPIPAFVSPVVVTGTNIRGLPPIGQNVLSIDSAAIRRAGALSLQQLLAMTVPQLNGFGSAGQTLAGFEPRLRSLGGSSSASTLILVDGHRIAPGGIQQTLAPDPNVIPVGAIERIDILPDGASALYGSDAVAGVINIVARKRYDGVELSGNLGFGDAYTTREVTAVYGKSWASGSAMATVARSDRSNLFAGDRGFVSGNQSAAGPGATRAGGANFNTYACSPATFIPASGLPGAGLVFSAPYSEPSIANTPTVNGLCSAARLVDLLPSETADRVFVSVRQELGRRLTADLNINVSRRNGRSAVSRGTISGVAVFGPGAAPPEGAGQINPFFQGPAGVNRGAVNFSFDDLFGAGAETKVIHETSLANMALDFDIGAGWQAALNLSNGRTTSKTITSGVVCVSCAYLALNGTTQASGVAASVGSDNLPAYANVTRLPLTTANALDVWTAGGGATSRAVLDALADNRAYAKYVRPFTDIVLKLDGPVWHLPGGELKAAIGGEYYVGGASVASNSTNAIGASNPSIITIAATPFRDRVVSSAFFESAIPIVGETMRIPLVRRLVLNVSGRVDHYSDIIDTANVAKNPRFGVDWEVRRGLIVKASAGTSFTAPQLGHNQYGGATSVIRDYFSTGGASFILPQGYPNSARLGCPATGACAITADSGKQGIITFGGNADLAPQTGRTWSVGLDIQPPETDLHAKVTLWSAEFRGAISNLTNVTQAAATPGLENLLIIAPTAEQIAKYTFGRTQTTPITTPIDFINITTQSNLFNVRGTGLDFDVRYDLALGESQLGFGVIGELKLKFEKQIANASWTRALDVANAANTISPLKLAVRGSIDWARGPWTGGLFANYVTDYFVIDGTPAFANSPCPATVTASGLGCQHVRSNLTFDTRLTRALDSGFAKQVQLNLDVHNLFNSRAPFINSPDTIVANGSLNVWSSAIGRVISIGIVKSW